MFSIIKINFYYKKAYWQSWANKEFSKWHVIFTDVTIANTILDRLLHHSVIEKK